MLILLQTFLLVIVETVVLKKIDGRSVDAEYITSMKEVSSFGWSMVGELVDVVEMYAE